MRTLFVLILLLGFSNAVKAQSFPQLKAREIATVVLQHQAYIAAPWKQYWDSMEDLDLEQKYEVLYLFLTDIDQLAKLSYNDDCMDFFVHNPDNKSHASSVRLVTLAGIVSLNRDVAIAWMDYVFAIGEANWWGQYKQSKDLERFWEAAVKVCQSTDITVEEYYALFSVGPAGYKAVLTSIIH